MVSFTVSDLRVQREAWPVEGGLLPVCHSRHLHGGLARTAVLMSLRPTHVYITAHRHGNGIHAYLLYYSEEIA